jgi:hypothetical protein
MIVESAQAVFALVPSECPDRGQEWLTHDTVVVADHRIWRVRIHHHVNVSDTAGSKLSKLCDTLLVRILNNPVLSMGLLKEHSNPFVGRVRPHKEWMCAVSLVSRGNTNIVSGWIVEIPHGIDTVLIEERSLRAFTQAHNSLIISVFVS